ncbi:hypothetical protein F4813DRAFT_370289 [Daldinia decipiens]|uniref:uncharacterized protein n=1 Tax=Daldinia decipiens TaxID=326647 RepID=UPI0020C3DBD0|nr:uncharacterized protein F4813DRAFT_370289 [Daldinia decipiens]KAI1654551.1 hypothetical protein F4813DRAFT_370289 [Daldinia decipiens]
MASLTSNSSPLKGIRKVNHPDFYEQLVTPAREIGEHWNLDPRLKQEDNLENLHIDHGQCQFSMIKQEETVRILDETSRTKDTFSIYRHRLS